jgi:hypothetical protein
MPLKAELGKALLLISLGGGVTAGAQVASADVQLNNSHYPASAIALGKADTALSAAYENLEWSAGSGILRGNTNLPPDARIASRDLDRAIAELGQEPQIVDDLRNVEQTMSAAEGVYLMVKVDQGDNSEFAWERDEITRIENQLDALSQSDQANFQQLQEERTFGEAGVPIWLVTAALGALLLRRKKQTA